MMHWIHCNRGLCHILMQVGHVAPLRWLSVFVCLLLLLRLLSRLVVPALAPAGVLPWRLPPNSLLQARSRLRLPDNLLQEGRSSNEPAARCTSRTIERASGILHIENHTAQGMPAAFVCNTLKGAAAVCHRRRRLVLGTRMRMRLRMR